jgi:hypothetical protein
MEGRITVNMGSKNELKPIITHQLLPYGANALLLLAPSLHSTRVRECGGEGGRLQGLKKQTSNVPLKDLCSRSFSILRKE